MTITAVASQEGGAIADNTTSVSRAFGSNVTAGNLVVVMASKFSPGSDPFVAGDCTKSAGTATLGTISLAVQVEVNSDNPNRQVAGIWYAVVSGTGSCTMRVGSALAASYLSIGTGEYSSDVGWSGAILEATNSNSTATDSQSPATTGNGTSAGAALFTASLGYHGSGNDAITEGASWTLIHEEQDGTLHQTASEIRRIVASGTTDQGSWTLTTSGNNLGWGAALAVFKEVAAAGGATEAGLLVPTNMRAFLGRLAGGFQ